MKQNTTSKKHKAQADALVAVANVKKHHEVNTTTTKL
jgi:hypothetical protein